MADHRSADSKLQLMFLFIQIFFQKLKLPEAGLDQLVLVLYWTRQSTSRTIKT